MKSIEFFDQNPVFTYEEFKQYAISQGTVNINTQKGVLAYHLKKQHIIRLRRALFASIPISSRNIAKSFLVDPYLVAGRITHGSVLSYHTAFDFYGISYSIFHQLTFMSQQKIKPFTFQQSEFVCLSFPKTLIDKNKMDFDVIKIDRQGLSIKVTSLERTIVDVLDRPEYAGGWEEIWRSTEHIPILNFDKIIEYALLLDNATTIAKVGFFLEQHKEQFNVDEKALNILESKKPTGVHYFERIKRESGTLVPRWNLVVPQNVIKRSWEEPSNNVF